MGVPIKTKDAKAAALHMPLERGRKSKVTRANPSSLAPLFTQEVYNKFLETAPSTTLLTPHTVSQRYGKTCSLSKAALSMLVLKAMLETVFTHHTLSVYKGSAQIYIYTHI